MKIALFSDLHAFEWREHSVTGADGVPSRLRHCTSVLTDIRTYCLEHGIGVVVCGGDLFHKRGAIYTQAYNLVVEELALFKEAGITMLMVDGNHDHADKAGTVHAIQALSGAGLALSVPAEGWVNWELNDDVIVSGFSYCDDRDEFQRRLEAAQRSVGSYGGHHVGVFHHGFKGAAVGSALEYTVREDIDPSLLAMSGFDMVFSGHYHQRQFIGGNERQMYIGSPLEHVRGDGGLAKGFIVYDTQKRTWKLVDLNRPRFTKLTQALIDAGDADTAWNYAVEGNYVDVAYEALPTSWDAYAAMLKHHGALGVKAVPLTREKATTTRLAIDTSLDTKTILKKYLKHREADLAGMDRAEVLRLGMDLIHRSS